MKCLSFLLALFVFLSGCGDPNDSIEEALQIRSRLNENGCEFLAKIVADYSSSIYEFDLLCNVDVTGQLSFEVKKPETISGIKGMFDSSGGKLTFDDKMLAFAPLCEGIVTPVSAPWIFLSAMKGGYIIAVEDLTDGYRLQYEGTYEGNVMKIHITVNADWIPIFAEIYWEECRVIHMIIDDFRFV